MKVLRITFVPPGEAPLWVREKWVGLTLPLALGQGARRTLLTSGVLSGPKGFLAWFGAFFRGELTTRSGFPVEVRTAIEVLERSSPEAAKWWRENAPHLLKGRRYFVFAESSGQIVDS